MNNNPISQFDTLDKHDTIKSRKAYRKSLPGPRYGECVEGFFTGAISNLELASYLGASEEWAELFFDMATTEDSTLTIEQRRKILYALTILRQYQLDQAQEYLDAFNHADLQ